MPLFLYAIISFWHKDKDICNYVKLFRERTTRLSKEQKQFFERAAVLGGYRSLTDFVILTVQEKAKRIVKERELVLATQKDSKIFFDALMNADKPNADKPNADLTAAAAEFKKLVSE